MGIDKNIQIAIIGAGTLRGHHAPSMSMRPLTER